MNPILRNIFGKKTQNDKTADKPSEKKEETFIPKSMKKVTRSSDGKFVSKAKPIKKEVQPKFTPAVIESASKNEEPKQITPNYQISTFYSKGIRKTYKDSAWYFSLEDMLIIAAVPDTEALLEKLKGKPSAKKTSDNPVTQVELSDQNGARMVDCITYKGFMTLLPKIIKNGYMFPGPFPSWLKDVSSLPSS